jgi:hypothetical protein
MLELMRVKRKEDLAAVGIGLLPPSGGQARIFAVEGGLLLCLSDHPIAPGPAVDQSLPAGYVILIMNNLPSIASTMMMPLSQPEAEPFGM